MRDTDMSLTPPSFTEPTPAHESVVDEDALLQMTNTGLDALFRSSEAGPVPDGDMRGTVLAFPATAAAKPLATVLRLVAWQGKVVDRRQGMLRNKVTPLGLRLVAAKVSLAPSWVDGRDCVLLDYSRTSWVARMVRDELRQVGPSLYLGVIWMWRRRVGWFTLRSSTDADSLRRS
jgi:hypothetical protein